MELKQSNTRGPYRSVAKGMIPKRRSEEAVQKLAEKSAKRGHELEIAKKEIKRKEQEIKTLEELLGFANKRVVCLTEEVEVIGNECDLVRQQEQSLQAQVEQLQNELSIYQLCLKNTEIQPSPIVKKKASLVVVGVNLLLKTVSLPFRALALVLNQLSPKLGYDHGVSISYQTLINTLCRVGLGLMKSHGKREDVWIGIVDFTMNQGPVRILPFLALSESRMNGNKATRLEDVECLDVIPMTRAKGSDIMTHYEALFERTGYPSAFLQDGGSNLNSAVNILNEKRASQKLPYIPVIRDVGHFSASITKGEFNQEDYIQGLLKQTTTFNSKVRPTQYAFLAAPKSRTAGRYMGYMKQVIRWLFRLENFTAGNGRPIEGSLRHYILEIFPNLYKTLKQVTSLVEVIEVEEFILKRLKTFGLTQSTYQSTIRKLKTLPEGHFYREAMMKWLEETWNIRKSIGIKGSLRVSSDIIETVNGLWKHITARAASNEVTHMALAFSTFFGSLTEEQIEWLIQDTPLWQVREWCDDKVPITQRKIKSMKFSPDTLLSEIDQLFAKYSPKISENTG